MVRVGRDSDVKEVNQGILKRPLLELYEGWTDEGGIDATKWTTTNSAGGPGWSRGATGAYLRATEVPILNNTARLVSDQRYIVAPDVYGTNTILRKFCFEFELRLTTVANLDNANSFFGLTTGAADDRTTINIVGWGLNTDVLESITDDAGTETVNTTFGETLTNWNKLRLEAWEGHVVFFINEAQVADHSTNLPDFPMYINYYLDTEGGGASTFELGIVRAWYEDIL